MRNDNEIEQLKELVRQQGIVISSLTLIIFRIVFNTDGVSFSKSINSDQMSDLLREARELTAKTRSVFDGDDSERG